MLKNVLFVTFFVFLDFFVKYLIRLFGGFYICNFGISWGIMFPVKPFWLIWILFLSFFVYLLKKTSSFSPSLLLILSGAIANGVDRALRGCITDFIKIPFINFPYFNIADVLIFIGCVLFLFKNTESKKTPFELV